MVMKLSIMIIVSWVSETDQLRPRFTTETRKLIHTEWVENQHPSFCHENGSRVCWRLRTTLMCKLQRMHSLPSLPRIQFTMQSQSSFIGDSKPGDALRPLLSADTLEWPMPSANRQLSCYVRGLSRKNSSCKYLFFIFHGCFPDSPRVFHTVH